MGSSRGSGNWVIWQWVPGMMGWVQGIGSCDGLKRWAIDRRPRVRHSPFFHANCFFTHYERTGSSIARAIGKCTSDPSERDGIIVVYRQGNGILELNCQVKCMNDSHTVTVRTNSLDPIHSHDRKKGIVILVGYSSLTSKHHPTEW